MKLLQRVGAVLVIIVATVLVYCPGLRNGFVWDDTALVRRDPLIRSWRLIPEGFQHFLFVDATASNFYRPIQRLVFTGNYALFGFEPAGWHATSILIHAAAAAMLLQVLLQWWGPERWRWALGVALIWAIHPLHTSAVTYVSGLADPLATLFGFTAIYLALLSEAKGRIAMLGAAACFLGAMLSKESGAMFLLTWLALLCSRNATRGRWLKWLLLAACIVGSYSALRFTASKTPPPKSDNPTPFSERVVYATRAASEYASLVVAPVTLRMERDISGRHDLVDRHAFRNLQTVTGILLIGSAVGFALLLRKRAPVSTLAIALAALTYLPISNLLPLNATIAEHWLYVPSAWLFAAIASALASLQWNAIVRRSALAVTMAWALFLGVRTWNRQGDWIDQYTFFTRTIADGGDTARMHLNLGNTEAASGHHDAAMREYLIALDRHTAGDFPWLAIATLHFQSAQFGEARSALAKCDPNGFMKADVLSLQATIDHREKGTDPTFTYRQASALNPRYWPLKKRYITALQQTQGPVTARRELLEFLEQQSFRADSWLTLYQLLEATGEASAARAAKMEAKARDVHLK